MGLKYVSNIMSLEYMLYVSHTYTKWLTKQIYLKLENVIDKLHSHLKSA